MPTGVLPYSTDATGAPTSVGNAPAASGVLPYSAASLTPAPTVAKKKPSLFDRVKHTVGQDLGKAGGDIRSIPGGLIKLGKDEYTSLTTPTSFHQDLQEWEHPLRPVKNDPASADVRGMLHGSVESLKHPGRDPFQTLMTLLPLAGAAGKAVDVGSTAAEAGDIRTGLARLKPGAPVKLRTLRLGDQEVPIQAAKGSAARAVQQGYDKVVQHALDTNPEGRIAAHGAKRIGNSITETERYRAQLREVPANEVEASMKLLKKGKSLAPIQVQQDALRLTAENSLPEDAVAHHLNMADIHDDLADKADSEGDGETADKHFEAAAANRDVADRFQAVAAHDIVHDNEGHLVINAEKFPHLAEADRRIAVGQNEIDDVALAHQGMSREGLQARIDAPNRYRAGAKYVNPTAARMGIPSPKLAAQRAKVARLEEIHSRAVDKATAQAERMAAKGGDDTEVIGKDAVGPGKVIPGKGSARADRLGAHLSVERDRLEQMETAAARRIKPSGIVGGEGAREGRGFVSYKTSEPAKEKAAVSSTAGPVIGEPKPFISKSQHFTGEGLNEGKVPADVVHMVAQHMREAYRYVNTHEFRKAIVKTGSRAKRSSRDVLVRIPGAKAESLGEDTRIELGQRKSTLDEVHGEATGYQRFLHDIIPGLGDKSVDDKAIGTAAPKGYRWVDKHVLGDLAKPAAGERGVVFRTMDNINSAITAATVYFKIGHVGTRVLTNAATNIIQGSAAPAELGRSVTLWKELSDSDRRRALAAAGQKGFDAMPAVGDGAIATVARGGAHWWAKHVDAPFRFNSIAYEARKAGFDTPAKFTKMLDDMETPDGLNAAETAKIDWVAKRANRQAIAYDRLSANEKKYVTRGVWFYPWIKGASVFAKDVLTEHPLKAATLGSAGVQGRQEQVKRLGDLPAYEQGLIPLGHGSHPTVTDFSTFSPFATPAQLIQALSNPSSGAIAGMANPAVGALDSLIHGQNQYGAKSKNPVGDALSQLVAPTPEMQILGAALHPPKKGSNHMFNTTWRSALLRSLVGPSMPRRINLDAAHSEAARIRSGR